MSTTTVKSLKTLQIIEPTIEERIEARKSYQDKNHIKNANVEAVLCRIEGNCIVKHHIYGGNVVCDTGDVYYTQMAAGVTPTNDFKHATNSRLEFRTSTDTPVKGDNYAAVAGLQSTTRHAIDAGYPKAPDTDTDNTGLGNTIVSYRYSYLTSEGNVNGIVGGIINATAGGSPLLCHFSIASFDKTNSDTLKFYVNHSFLGA